MDHSGDQPAQHRNAQLRSSDGALITLWVVFLAALAGGGMLFVNAFWRVSL